LKERAGDWAAKDEVSEKRKKKKIENIPVHYSSRRVNQHTAQRQQTNKRLRNLAEKKMN
jgi:hypothetical protein